MLLVRRLTLSFSWLSRTIEASGSGSRVELISDLISRELTRLVLAVDIIEKLATRLRYIGVTE